MKTYRQIMVGVDYSPASKSALRTAVRLAAVHGAHVTAVHVIDPKLAGSIREAHQWTDEQLFKHIGESVHAFLADVGVAPGSVATELDVGHPFVGLVAACQRHSADLLVLGTRGTEHGPNEVGAVASKCLRKAPADVLLVREGAPQAFERVTVCADLSETSAKAVRAARLVAEQDKAALDCLFVYQSALALSLDYGGFVPPLPMLDVDSSLRWKNELGEFLAPLLRTATDLNWQSVVMERVNIREAIIEHIRESKTDLVVLGTRGKTDLRSLLLGTTAEKVVTHAPCSILAVKPDDFVYPLEDKTTLPPATAPLA